MLKETPVQDFGRLLREWRRKRRMSQSDFASDAEISTRHLGLLETGHAQPSRPMLLRLASSLRMPLRDRNALLIAAGFPPMFKEHAFNAPALDIVRRNVEILLAAYEPNPALVVDGHWTILTANRAVAHLVAGAEPMLLRPPVNIPRLLLHPAGLASRIVNLAQWRAHMIERLRRQIEATFDPVLIDLLEEIRDYPTTCVDESEDTMVAAPLRLATFDGVLSFFNTTTSFATPIDITVAEMTIEAFLPADAETAATMRRLAQNDEPARDSPLPADVLS